MRPELSEDERVRYVAQLIVSCERLFGFTAAPPTKDEQSGIAHQLIAADAAGGGFRHQADEPPSNDAHA